MAEEPADGTLGDDVRLIGAVAEQRDPDALAQLYDRYAGLAYGITLRIVKDPGVAEDIVQEAFFGIWRKATGYSQQKGSVRTWLLSVVHNRAIDKLRRLRTRQSLDTQLEAASGGAEQPDVWPEVLADYERQRIGTALNALPTEQRKAIELAYFGGYTHAEIANLLRVPVGTVKGRLRLGMDKLRTALSEPVGREWAADT